MKATQQTLPRLPATAYLSVKHHNMLRKRAGKNGRSISAEAGEILVLVLDPPLATFAQALDEMEERK